MRRYAKIRFVGGGTQLYFKKVDVDEVSFVAIENFLVISIKIRRALGQREIEPLLRKKGVRVEYSEHPGYL
jgi:hypothetical protein